MDRDRGVALARAALGGDVLAMSDLLDLLAPYVGRICGPIALDGGADAAQETLIVVFRGLRGLRDPEALYGWVRTIAVREAVRVARAQARSVPVELDELPAMGDPQLAADIRDVLDRLQPEHRAALVPAGPGGPRRERGGAALERARGHREVPPTPRPEQLPKGVDIMTDAWPVADLDPVRRLTVLAAAIPGARVASRIVAAPFNDVWAVMSDLEGELGHFQPDLHRLRVTRRDGERLEAVARSRWGMRARFDVLLQPGWCWMQSRFLLVGMAARPDEAGTLVALTGGIRVPGRARLVPVLVGPANRRAADRLAARVTARRG